MDFKSLLFYRDLFIHDNNQNRNSIKIEIRLSDSIDPLVFKESVIKTMKRYPYYCVTLVKENEEYFFRENNKPIVILNSLDSPTFNSDETNYHFISFGYKEDWFVLNIFHGLTDGTGAYEVLKTLLYYYCEKRYKESEEPLNVRLLTDEIKEDEWYDPYKNLVVDSIETGHIPSKAINIIQDIDSNDNITTVHHLSINEKQFMDFCIKHDSTPATMIALLLSRIINKMHPDDNQDIRFLLCTNDRKFLGASNTCLNMVGTLPLEFKPELRDWSLDKQATSYRGMVFAKTYEDNVIKNAINTKKLCEAIYAIKDDKKRTEFAKSAISGIVNSICGMISYVGKTNFPNADKYIKDFRTLAEGAAPFGIEIATADGCFKLDVIQKFKDLCFVEAFQKELNNYGIEVVLADSFKLDIAKANLPWLM